MTHKQQKYLASLIEPPDHLACRPGISGFGDHLAKTVMAVCPQKGNFRTALEKTINSRIELAIKNDDIELIKTLMVFKQTREKGQTLTGLNGRSFTKIDDKGNYAGLYHQITKAYFPNASTLYECRNPLPEENHWTQKIEFDPQNHILWYHHADDAAVPQILNHLESLWDLVLSGASIEESVELLAQFEWWFISPNIPGRAGASIGNCLSLALQTAIGIILQYSFEHIDWDILSTPLEAYILQRKNRIT